MGIALEDLGVAAQALHAFLNTGTAAIDHAHDGRAGARRQVHHPANLAGLHLTQAAALNGEILGVGVNGAAIHLAVTGHNAIAIEGIGGRVGLLGDERFQFTEGSGVHQRFNALEGGKGTLGVVFVDSGLTAAQTGFLTHFL